MIQSCQTIKAEQFSFATFLQILYPWPSTAGSMGGPWPYLDFHTWYR